MRRVLQLLFEKSHKCANIKQKTHVSESRIGFFDTMPIDVRDQCSRFKARPRLTIGLGFAMTNLA